MNGINYLLIVCMLVGLLENFLIKAGYTQPECCLGVAILLNAVKPCNAMTRIKNSILTLHSDTNYSQSLT